jgi:hypothetical protein
MQLSSFKFLEEVLRVLTIGHKMCKIALFEIIHRLKCKITIFRTWILLPSSGKENGERGAESRFRNIVILYTVEYRRSPKEQFYS